MTRKRQSGFSRRAFLKSGVAAATLAGLHPLQALLAGRARGANHEPKMADRLLFVFSATGGASLVDSFMAVGESEPSSTDLADELLVYPDAFVKSFPGTNIRALDLPPEYRAYLGYQLGIPYAMSQFVSKHASDMAVLTLENTSVNHLVAQERSLNGQGINAGRTLGEHIADVHGQNLLLPYVNMASGGYLAAGTDSTLPNYAVAETVAAPHLFSLGTDGMRGMRSAPGAKLGMPPSKGVELDRGRALMARARQVRGELDKTSLFGQTFQCSPLLQRYLNQRETTAMQIEELDLITKLFMFSGGELPIELEAYGLSESAEALAARKLVSAWPNDPNKEMSVLFDPQVSQVILAYLLAKNGYSCASVFGPSFSPNPYILDQQPPLVFDYSHNNHVATQGVMWSRVLDLTDKLIGLLKATPAGAGETMWDRSLIYIATDFGRDKRRNTKGQPLYTITPEFQPNPHNTGHHLNNGCVLISPLLKPGVFGAVDPDTLLTYGFNRTTGVADKSELMRIGDIYSVIANALDAPFPGMVDIPALIPG
jgi:hypothetical protein